MSITQALCCLIFFNPRLFLVATQTSTDSCRQRMVNCIKTKACKNGGFCKYGNSSECVIVCNCVAPFSGISCESTSPREDTSTKSVSPGRTKPKRFEICSDGLKCHNGRCIKTPSSFFCECRFGWRGRECLTRTIPPEKEMVFSLCNGTKCYHGMCQGDPLRCQCGREWSGVSCKVNISDYKLCSKNLKCYRGKCVRYGLTNRYRCRCERDWRGRYCNRQCSLNCMNGARCLFSSKFGPMCKCKYGYRGRLCEIETSPNKTTCRHKLDCYEGTCVDVPDTDAQICQCKPGWRNIHCNSTCHKECQNGGTCFLDEGCQCYACRCPWDFIGKDCGIRRSTVEPKAPSIAPSVLETTTTCKSTSLGGKGIVIVSTLVLLAAFLR